MGFAGSAFRILWSRILPVVVLLVAIFVGWIAQHDQPAGLVFATIFPILKGHLPPSIVGHGKMSGTPEVPADMVPEPRPAQELFRDLPGGFKMPQAGLGMCCRYSAYDDVLVRRTVLWYLLLGGRHIDGAHLYLNHKAIGQGIADAVARGIPREEIFVTTKIFPYKFGYEETVKTVPTYLEELGLEYIDLVLIHMPSAFPLMTNECKKKKVSNKECREETWKALSELKEKGIMRNIGVSNFAVNHLKEIEALSLSPIAVNQFQYNPWAPKFIEETYDYCQKRNITVTAYASLGGSFQHAEAQTVETLNTIAAKHGKSVAQIMLRWAIQSNAVVIPGTGNPKHMRENLDVYSFELSPEDMNAIHALRSDEGAKKFFYIKPPT